MYALYACRDEFSNVFLRTFPHLGMMCSDTIELGSGTYDCSFPEFPEAFEPFAFNLRNGSVYHFADEWSLVLDEAELDRFFASFYRYTKNTHIHI